MRREKFSNNVLGNAFTMGVGEEGSVNCFSQHDNGCRKTFS